MVVGGSAEPIRLSALEIAGGIVLGVLPAGPARTVPSPSPAQALEAAILPALQFRPCLVSFSGGIDSSLVLGAAVRLARRLGLDEPVPVTLRFADAPRAEERSWQERVVGELGLSDWERIEVDDDLDLVGPHAQRVLRRHGVLYPSNTYVHAPLLERAHGGALLTGVGGDHVLGPGRWRDGARVLADGRRPTLRGAAHVVLAVAPAPVRVRLDPRRRRLRSPWLSPDVARKFAASFAATRAREPLWWSARVAWQRRRRDLALMLASFELLAGDAGARIVHPLVDDGFVRALGHAGGRRGFATRTAAVASLLGGTVPTAVLERRTKAVFGEGFWREPSRALAREWSGEGVDTALVDVGALQSIWRAGPIPPFRTSLLLQQVWLSTMERCGSGRRD